MDSPNKPSWLLPSIVLAGLAALSLTREVAPLDLVRPQSMDERAVRANGLERIPAHLWEDPFDAVQRAESKTGSVPRTPAPLALKRDAVVIALLVPGGSSGVDSENRMRTRYAALASTGVEGLVPNEPGHVGVLEHEGASIAFEVLQPDPFRELRGARQQRDERAAAPPSQVVLLWINESNLGGEKPLHGLHTMLEEICAEPAASQAGTRHPRYAIVGPTSSDGLVALLEDSTFDACEKRCVFDGTPWYSTWATISGPELRSQLLDAKLAPELLERLARPRRRSELEPFQLGCGLLLTRTIGSDERLIEALVAELSGRGVGNAPIALITEWESSYARSFVSAFERVLEARGEGQDTLTLDPIYYASGIDGVVPGVDAEVREGPVGEKRTDYLRRLESKLLVEGKSYRAIGIVGSDIYDKLLILRALRPLFPKAVFFTTDLDAWYLSKVEYKWTRNLVVASHFGLKPVQRRPRGGPVNNVSGTLPFRDSYQTANFVACQAALRYRPTPGGPTEHGDAPPTGPPAPAGESPGAGTVHAGQFHPDSVGLYEIGHGQAFPLNRGQIGSGAAIPFEWAVLRWMCWAALTGMILIRRWGGVPSKNGTGRWTRAWWSRAIWITLTASLTLIGGAELVAGHASQGHTWPVIIGWLTLALAILATTLIGYAVVTRRVRSTRSADSDAPSRWKDKSRKPLPLTDIDRRESGRVRAKLILHGAPWVCVSLLLLEGTIVLSQRLGQLEPISLLIGISAWPAIFLRLSVIFGAIGSVLFLSTHLRNRERKIARAFGLPVNDEQPERCSFCRRIWREFLGLWHWVTGRHAVDRASKPSMASLWKWYQGMSRHRISRSTPAAVLFTAIIFALYLLDGPATSARGTLTRWAHGITWVASLSSLAMLLFYVLDATFLCHRFLARVVRPEEGAPWPKRARRRLLQRLRPAEATAGGRGAGSARAPERQDPDRDWHLDNLWHVRFFAALTEDIGRLVWLPFVLLCALVIGQSTVFENWSWSPFSVGLLAANVTVLIVAAGLLRSAAERLRAKARNELRDHQLYGKVHEEEKTVLNELDHALTEVEGMRRGAFLPFAQHPITTALLLPFGGVGTIAVLEHLVLRV